ncbi:MAG: hypothetical protein E3J88_06385, partial [Anaerolineales bacterium]
ENLRSIQEALLLVITNSRGTAYRTFTGVNHPIRIYGKTGTAQNPGELPHAWFIGYTNHGNPNRPDIAIAVILENLGDGSEFAAPVFRRLVDVYFYGSPQFKYDWETRVGEFNPEYFEPEEEDEGEGGGNP